MGFCCSDLVCHHTNVSHFPYAHSRGMLMLLKKELLELFDSPFSFAENQCDSKTTLIS